MWNQHCWNAFFFNLYKSKETKQKLYGTGTTSRRKKTVLFILYELRRAAMLVSIAVFELF
jgi:hypothetical protein